MFILILIKDINKRFVVVDEKSWDHMRLISHCKNVGRDIPQIDCMQVTTVSTK